MSDWRDGTGAGGDGDERSDGWTRVFDRPVVAMAGLVPRRATAAGLVGLVGAATFVVHALHLVLELGEFASLAVGVLPPMAISLALLAGAHWLRTHALGAYDAHVVVWVCCCAAVAAALGSSSAVYQWTHGVSLDDVPFMLTNWVTTGALVGFLVGVYDARWRTIADDLRAEHDALAARERQLEREVDRLDRFAGVVSHDLRNPLNVAQGRLELAREDGDEQHLAVVADSLDRMETIVEDVLTMAREGAAVPNEEREPVDVADAASACWQNVDTGDATLVADVDLTISAAPGRLHSVFENLFRNAVEHGRAVEDGGDGDHAELTVRVGALDDGAGFFVEDDGPGFDDPDAVFEAGYTTAEAGTGLGLSIVAEVLTGHGWTVRATEGRDGGARIEVRGVDAA